MNLEEKKVISPLEKPLKDLTEEDISQLTREDCRRFLKQKGMRRPSWNKSQAIEQVISLKTLLESPTASYNPDQAVSNSPPTPQPKAVSNTDSRSSSSSGVSVPDLAMASQRALCGDTPASFRAVDVVLPRIAATELAMENSQMTIFYSGRVNVYEDVPFDKAQEIFVLAGSHNCWKWSMPADVHLTARHIESHQLECSKWCLPSLSPTGTHSILNHSGSGNQSPCDVAEGIRITHEYENEGLSDRRASLQRYLEKRKDRGRVKARTGLGIHPVREHEVALS